MGWLMIAALVFSAIPPVLLGHAKIRIARTLSDKVLYTDAETNKADWQTSLAGIVGIMGVAAGLWWADAVMAVLISVSILKDGVRGLRIAIVSLLDGAPRKLDSMEIDPDAARIVDRLSGGFRSARVQIRETGRYFRVNVEPEDEPHIPDAMADALMDQASWRLIEVSLAVRDALPEEGEDRDPKA
jgi:divalent metal cation (Fe/Co/Zn/Cd) transporter